MNKKIIVIGFIFAFFIIGNILVNAFSNTNDNDENIKTKINRNCTNCTGTFDMKYNNSENCNEICNSISSKSCNEKQQCNTESITGYRESYNCNQDCQINRNSNSGGCTRSNSCNE